MAYGLGSLMLKHGLMIQLLKGFYIPTVKHNLICLKLHNIQSMPVHLFDNTRTSSYFIDLRNKDILWNFLGTKLRRSLTWQDYWSSCMTQKLLASFTGLSYLRYAHMSNWGCHIDYELTYWWRLMLIIFCFLVVIWLRWLDIWEVVPFNVFHMHSCMLLEGLDIYQRENIEIVWAAQGEDRGKTSI